MTKKMPDATAACTRLLSEAGVALVPATPSGAPDCIRFSYAVADDVLMDALARVRKGPSSDNNADLRFRGFPEPENAARGRHFSGDGMHTLDWKHAWTGRLLTTAPTRPQALKLLEPQLDSCNARLIGEVASGKLPFLNLPFRSSLTARLKALTPQLRRFKHMVVLGIGGSALGTRALQKGLFPSAGSPEPPGAVAVDPGQRGRRRARSADVHPSIPKKPSSSPSANPAEPSKRWPSTFS